MQLLRATRSELSVESFFPKSYGTFKLRVISETIIDFSILLKDQKMFLFDHLVDIRDEPPGHGALSRLISQPVQNIKNLKILHD